MEEVKANINADEQQENANDDEIQEKTKQEKNGDDIEAKATEQKPAVSPPAPAPSAITSKVEFAQEDHPIDDDKKHLEQEKEIISEQIENQKLVQEQEVEPLDKSLQPNISEGPLTLSTVEDSNVSEKEISFEQVSEGSLQSESDGGQDQIETDADDEVKDGEDDENEVFIHVSYLFTIFSTVCFTAG